jgi:hypothetical protein
MREVAVVVAVVVSKKDKREEGHSFCVAAGPRRRGLLLEERARARARASASASASASTPPFRRRRTAPKPRRALHNCPLLNPTLILSF